MFERIVTPTFFAALLLVLTPPASAQSNADVTLADPAEAQVEQRDDGSLLVDGKYVIRGGGTADDPYRVGWDLLNSAASGFDAATGKLHVPARVAMLDGKHVRVEGYLLMPMSGATDEVLAMQNQWDGCCIGIPPTPYASVEGALAEPIDFGFGGRQYATITGRMRVEPYLFGSGMLLGLYEIVDAEIEVTEW